ncbi:hypothetical protein CHS0354_023125 [Potamilus streckersoni]|uniref:C-type lectin domain-containing protein n=1 Tax=Potamilus streckersoni TaxID=2493646 RepID=A0AAE0RN49_9BIVA|nr:hypothetical protein CHS0354_023125 [Potamilus streckersoni]
MDGTHVCFKLLKLHSFSYAGPTKDVHHWIDGSDILTENEWRWMGREGVSKPIVYTNWYPGQPDNTGDTEHCLELMNAFSGNHGQYNDYPCDSRHGLICEAR